MKQKVCKNEKKTLFHVLLRTITNLQHRISKYSKIHHARTRAHTDTTHLVTKSYADLISHITGRIQFKVLTSLPPQFKGF